MRLPKHEREELLAHYAALTREFIGGRPWISATDIVIGAAQQGKMLLKFGAERVLAIGGSRGAGDLPDPDEMKCIDLEVTAENMMEGIRRSMATLENLPDWAAEEVNRFDPAGEAQVLGTIFCSDGKVGGREVFGGRPKAWRDLEDKTIVDAFWDAAGIERAESAIVATDLDTLRRTADRLDLGAGTVWVADNKEGWHGGGKMLRWVRTDAEAIAAHEFLSTCSDVVRVMPFLDGIPCSIHGWVFPDTTIGFRPCEMLVFRRPDSDKLVYAGAATCWTPAEADRAAMRSMVVSVGEHLRATVGYRGSYTVDGVMTEDGFRPTELNPRFGAAIARMSTGMPELPLYFLHLATAQGLDLDYRPQDLERLVVGEAHAYPQSRALYLAEGHTDIDNAKVQICRTGDGRWRVIEEGEQQQGLLTVGPAAAGTILLVHIDQDHVTLGPSAGPDIIAAFELADEQWGIGIGKLEAAPDLRKG